MAETADQAHAVELAGAFLEAADQEHVAVCLEQVFLAHLARLAAALAALGRCALWRAGPAFAGFGDLCHAILLA